MMPQKKNPDIADLARGKAGRLIGHLTGFLTTLKGLPLTYNKDMQEDKEPLFDAADSLALALAAMEGMARDMAPNAERLRAAAGSGYSTATDLADWLVRVLGMPFRDAHHVTGRIVSLAEADGCDLGELALDKMQAVEPRLTSAVYDVLSVEASSASRTSYGGTAPVRVREQVALWQTRLTQEELG